MPRAKERVRIKSLYFKPFPPIDFEEIADYGLEEITKKPEEEIMTTPNSPNSPKNFKEFIGQAPTKNVLRIIIGASIKNKQHSPNILLTGEYGHGKTTLARLIVEELENPFKIIDGVIAETLLDKPNPKIIYIIDEIHNISPTVADSLNILLDNNKLHLIGCTTSPGKLQAPFRSRFRQLYLDEYTIDDIGNIVKRAAKRSGTKIDNDSITLIAIRSKLNPRIALSILDFLRELQTVDNLTTITTDITNKALNSLRIDKYGLTELDRKYLAALKYDNPVGLRHIMSVMSLDSGTIEEQIEPYLLKIGMIDRTSKGRVKIWTEGTSFE